MNRFARKIMRVAMAALVVAGSVSGAARMARAAESGTQSAPLLLRNPSVNKSSIAFLYADDVWTVSRAGGEATRLTATGAVEAGPFYSPDGERIAFTEHRAGGNDVYIVAATGGIPHRITWHPDGSTVVGWTPDGTRVLIATGMSSPRHFERFYTVKADGSGMPEMLPLWQGFEGSYSPDGASIAYEPVTRWEDAWKTYYGGQNDPIWVVNLKTLALEKIPSENTTDTHPVWAGHSIYFLSNRVADGADLTGSASVSSPDAHRGPRGPVSLYRYDTGTKQVSLVEPNHGLDLKTMQIGAGALVYEQFGSIHLMDLSDPDHPTGDHAVPIRIDGDLDKLEPHPATVAAREIDSYGISPTGKRAVFSAHGEIFTVPAEKGDTRNLTETPGVEERSPAWSPDGSEVAYFSDATGEYALYLKAQNGLGEATKIDLGPDPSFFYSPKWSPDGKHILYRDKHERLWYVDVPVKGADGKWSAAGAPVLVDQSHRDSFGGNSTSPEWSPDSEWIVYTREAGNDLEAVFLYSLAQKKFFQVTDAMSDAASPVFDPSGKELYFLASTDDGPSRAGIDLSSLDRAQQYGVYTMVLAKDGASPVPPESDDEKPKDAAKPDAGKPDAGKSDASKTDAGTKSDAKSDAKSAAKTPVVKVDLDGIENRILALPIRPRNWSRIYAPKQGVLLLTADTEVGRSSDESDGALLGLWRFTTKERKTEQVSGPLGEVAVSADGSHVLIGGRGHWSIAKTDELKPGTGMPGKPLNMGQMRMTMDPRAEWRQMYAETWRIERDFLYDPNTHGLSISKAEAMYRPYLAGLASRSEFTYLCTEMLGQINIGHMFIRGPRAPDATPKTGLLGADYAEANGRYQFHHILGGENWTPGLASPLTVPGVEVSEGDYLLAVNGVELHAGDNLYRAFAGTAGQQTVIRVGAKADGSDAREVTVVPVASESGLRELDWIQSNLRKTDALSGGKVAYVYMPDTGGAGYTNFNRYFYSQLNKQALVLDERNNNGGLIADYIVDTLRRTPLSMAIERDGRPEHDPVGAIFGPKAMIINQNSGSGGDAMPWYFRKAGLGKLIGTRTWGGLVGIGGYPRLMDGGTVTAPRYAIYGLDGHWEVENRGIAPDIDVDITPKDFAAGRDPQLETAVKTVLDELKAHPLPEHPQPPYPNYHQHDALGH